MASLDAQPHRDMVRIHESGDFWHEHYMKAWMLVAKEHPQVKFYAYTKSLQMWYHLQDDINSNFYLTASYGGNEDFMIEKFPEVYKRIAYVVYTEQEAADRGLEIDHDDSHCFGDKPFALLVHGSQEMQDQKLVLLFHNVKKMVASLATALKNSKIKEPFVHK